MKRVPNRIAVFEQGREVRRYDIFKSGGDQSNDDEFGNRYVYIDGELKLIAAVWDRKFKCFEDARSDCSKSPSGERHSARLGF